MAMVTRRPKKRFRMGRFVRKVVLPIAAIGALAGAIVWPPSHKIIFQGPAKPFFDRAAPIVDQAQRPLHFIAQQQTITDKNRQIQQLTAQLEKSRKDLASRDDQIKALQGQINDARSASSASTPAPPVRPVAPAAPGAPVAPGQPQAIAAAGAVGGAGAQVDPDIKRTAAVWGQMDAEAVAGLVQKLPQDYVTRVFAQLSPDQVGQIMEALPATVAAKLSQARASTP